MLYLGQQNWAFSSTGNFMDNDLDSDNYIVTNVSMLYNSTTPVSELYRTARVSPLSLTYYGLCLLNGNYTVKLHFAEIIFTNDSTFNSLGKRIFDVYLQVLMTLALFSQRWHCWNVWSLLNYTMHHECRKSWFWRISILQLRLVDLASPS